MEAFRSISLLGCAVPYQGDWIGCFYAQTPMKLYRIKDWELHFENNRSKTVGSLRWVPIPNKHDGENFVTIIKSKHGAEIFAAWVLIIQVASKCQPRGTLMRGNCQPHAPATLSIKTGAPEAWFKLALDFLEEHTDWLVVEEVAGGCQPPVRQVPENGIEVPRREGIEGREDIEQKEHPLDPATNALRLRIGSWFSRRESTKWSAKELKALKDVIKLGTPPEDIDLLEAWYRSGDLYLRKDIITLLNNWGGEIDRARTKVHPTPQASLFTHEPQPAIADYL